MSEQKILRGARLEVDGCALGLALFINQNSKELSINLQDLRFRCEYLIRKIDAYETIISRIINEKHEDKLREGAS